MKERIKSAILWFFIYPVFINAIFLLLSFVWFFFPVNVQNSYFFQQVNMVVLNIGILLGYLKLSFFINDQINQNITLCEELSVEMIALKLTIRNNKRMWFFCISGSLLLPGIMEFVRIQTCEPLPPVTYSSISLFIPFFVAPLIEEYFFRKTLYKYLWFNNQKLYCIFSVLFFTLVHGYSFSVYSGINLIKNIFYSFFFLVFPFIYTQSLVFIVVNHIALNLSVFFPWETLYKNEKTKFFIFIICLGSFLYSVINLLKTNRPNRTRFSL